jgi:CheY-like chemotaxis protein
MVSIRVLYVGDDTRSERRAETFLEREVDRIEVHTARSTEDGLDRIAGGGVDCVVLETDASENGGLAFLDRVREAHPDIPFVPFANTGEEGIVAEQYELLADRRRATDVRVAGRAGERRAALDGGTRRAGGIPRRGTLHPDTKHST